MNALARVSSRVAGSVALATVCAGPARAQSWIDSELRAAPQLTQYHFGSPTSETVSQLAVPIFVTVPIDERFTVDVGTSFASTRVTSSAGTSAITGLTDTQLRGNLALGSDFVVLTLGLNLPTGRSTVTLDQFRAAGLIGNDFLGFPISSMGTGLAVTAGAAVARPFGEWNLGAGASMRHSAAYEPFDVPGQSMRFQPGNEYRVRVGADRPLGAGRVAVGVTYSAFGKDDAFGSVYNTGNRVITQALYSNSLANHDVTLAAYNVFRGRGMYATGDAAGRENLADLFASMAFDAGGRRVEPSIELRHWLQNVIGSATTADRTQSSILATLGVRTHADVADVRITPSVGYTFGNLATADTTGAPARAALTGFRLQVAARFVPFAGR